MKLNHDIYEEAMDSVRLSEERGIKLLEEAVYRGKQRRQKKRVQAAAIIAVFLTAALSLNGICYAQTGKNAWEMFHAFFDNSNQGEMIELTEKAKESGESFTYKNLKFTLEQYLYDQENSELFYSVLVESTDGTPLDEEQMSEDYIILAGRGSGSTEYTRTEWSKDKTSYREYGAAKSNYDKFGKPMDMEQLQVCIYEGDCPAIGSFDIEPTGRMKTRYFDVSFIEGCSKKAKITGTGVKLFFEKRWFGKDGDDRKNRPFERLDVVMKDGTVFRGGIRGGRDVIPVYNSKGELLNEEEIQAATKAEDIRDCYEEWSFGDPNDDKYWLSYRINFTEFINVDDIDAVYLDNVRMPLE